MNLESYAIKKSLPRLVAATLLIQFSFVICGLIIDIGNILAGGMADFIANTSQVSSTGESGLHAIIATIVALMVGVTALILLPSAIAKIGAVVIIGAVIALAFAVLSVLFTLIVRKLIITILIAVSPLAFMAMVLPSTEKFFSTWYKNFIRLIMMYPIIVLLFSVAPLAQALTSGNVGVTSLDRGINSLIAAAFPIIACFMVPMSYKWGGQFMSAAASYTTKVNQGKKLQGAWKNSEAGKAIQGRHDSRREQQLEHDLKGKGLKKYMAGVKTRGDVFAGKSPGLKEGGKWYRPDHWTRNDESRAGVLQRQQALQLNRMQAEQVKGLREQYDTLSTEDLKERMKTMKSPLHLEAMAAVAVNRGAADQPEFLAALSNHYITEAGKLSGKEATDKLKEGQEAVARVRAVKYGTLLESAPAMTSLDIAGGEKKIQVDGNEETIQAAGDTFHDSGAIIGGYGSVKGVATKAGDKLAGMTGPGWSQLETMRASRDTLEQVYRSDDVADDVKVRIRTLLDSNRGRNEFGIEDQLGARLVSDVAKQHFAKSNIAAGKVGPKSAAERIVFGDHSDYSRPAANSGQQGGGSGSGGTVDGNVEDDA